jgi:exonuclease VII large subunit
MEDTLDYISNNFHFNKPLNILNNYKIRLDEYERNILNMKNDKFYRLNNKLDNLEKLLESFGPEQTLKRGYSFVLKDGKLVKSKKSLIKDDEIDINFFDGSVNAEIK